VTDSGPTLSVGLPALPDTLRAHAVRAAREELPVATACPTCGAHFSADGRFCPFDGSVLVTAQGWGEGAHELVGSVIDGRYEVLALIGEGGMGVVYEVRHVLLGRRFALKALRKQLTVDSELSSRFIQEARTAAAVSHPGLVEIIDFGRLGSGQVYFVMELLEGCSLAALLRRGPVPLPRALGITRQLGLALQAAHRAGVVHRDLKPDNILIGRGDAGTDRVKVVDFGLAKVIGSSRVTRAGIVFGTPHYMSPEQAAGEVVDQRADIYALGVVMYELFTGRLPFEAKSYRSVMNQHLSARPRRPSTLNPKLEQLGPLEHVVLRALAKRPEERYENLAALLADLEASVPPSWLASAPWLDADSPPVGERDLGAVGRGVMLLLVALSVAAACFALGDWFLRRASHVAVSPATATRRPASPLNESAPQPAARSVTNSLPVPAAAREPARKPTAGRAAPSRGRQPSHARPSSSAATSDIIDPWRAAR
jgi:serine/threonine protein kinase